MAASPCSWFPFLLILTPREPSKSRRVLCETSTLAGEGLGSDFCHKARSPKENVEYVNFILRVKVALLLY